MKYKILILSFLCLISLIQCAPGSSRLNPNCIMAQIEECDPDSGPVCGIDASGLTRTFENRCMANTESCRRGTFFVEVKPGEC